MLLTVPTRVDDIEEAAVLLGAVTDESALELNATMELAAKLALTSTLDATELAAIGALLRATLLATALELGSTPEGVSPLPPQPTSVIRLK